MQFPVSRKNRDKIGSAEGIFAFSPVGGRKDTDYKQVSAQVDKIGDGKGQLKG